MIACARMYAASPGLTAAWRTLLEWVAARAEAPMDVIEHAYPAPLDELRAREDMGCVFMCGYQGRPPLREIEGGKAKRHPSRAAAAKRRPKAA